MAEKFASHKVSLSDPATRHFAITPGTAFAQPTRGIYVGGDGNIVIQDMNEDAVTYTNAKAGSIIHIRAKFVVASGTTATGLIGMY